MDIEFDEEKRLRTLDQRGLDFAHAARLFDGEELTLPDDRADYGEDRFFTVGFLDGRMVLTVWTPRGEARRIISMRKCKCPRTRQIQRILGSTRMMRRNGLTIISNGHSSASAERSSGLPTAHSCAQVAPNPKAPSSR